MRHKKNSVGLFQRYTEKSLKTKFSRNEVALRQVVRKQVSFQDRKKENTPKCPSSKMWYKQHSKAAKCDISSILTLLINKINLHLYQTSFQVKLFYITVCCPVSGHFTLNWNCNNFPFLVVRVLKFGSETIYLVLNMTKGSLIFCLLFYQEINILQNYQYPATILITYVYINFNRQATYKLLLHLQSSLEFDSKDINRSRNLASWNKT